MYPNADALRALRAAGAEPIGEDEEAMRAALREATCVVFAEETPKKLRATVEATMKRVDAGDASVARRCDGGRCCRESASSDATPGIRGSI